MRIPSSRWPKKRSGDVRAGSRSAKGRLDHDPAVRALRALSVTRLHPETKELIETSMHWGLIPHYSTERPELQPLYAPVEILRRRIYLGAYRKRRCIIPMNELHQRDRQNRRIRIAHQEGKI